MVDAHPPRLLPSGARIHVCTNCGRADAWGPTWSWYGSLAALDAGRRVVKACCEACREALAHEEVPRG